MSDRPHDSKTGTLGRRSMRPDRIDAVFGALGRRLGSSAWLSRAAAVGLCSTSLVFVATLGAAIASHGQVALVTKPPEIRIALALAYLVPAFAAGTAVGAVLGWRNRYWSPATRVHQTALALLGVGLVWKLSALGFLG